MLTGVLLNFGIALLTGLISHHPYVKVLEIVIASFLFSMFSIYGKRISAIGLMALMVMVVTLYRHPPPSKIIFHSLLILAGGCWYFALSLFFYWLMPNRERQHALVDCLFETAESLWLRGIGYISGFPTGEGPDILVRQHARLSEKQDSVRQLLSHDKRIKGSSPQAKIRALQFTDLVDLYEQLLAVSVDQEVINVQFAGTAIPEIIAQILIGMADELQRQGHAIQYNTAVKPFSCKLGLFVLLNRKVDEVVGHNVKGGFVLRANICLLQHMMETTRRIAGYGDGRLPDTPTEWLSPDADEGAQPWKIKWSLFYRNLNVLSVNFRHALRMACVAFAGFLAGNSLASKDHSYWILFTIIFILKPEFGVSSRRNYQRLAGTLIGALISLCILSLVHRNTPLLILLMVFMVGGYSFLRSNYFVYITFLTSYILIFYGFEGEIGSNLVGERVLDTLIGSALALAGDLFLFPNWEYMRAGTHIAKVVTADANWLAQSMSRLIGTAATVDEYRPSRTRALAFAAGLTNAYQNMAAEAKWKRIHSGDTKEFILMNYQLSCLIASLAVCPFCQPPFSGNDDGYKSYLFRKSLFFLYTSVHLTDPADSKAPTSPMESEWINHAPASMDEADTWRIDRLEAVCRVSAGILEKTAAICAVREPRNSLPVS